MNILNRSHLKTKNGISYFEAPHLAQVEWVHHAFLTRRSGVSLPPYDSLNLSDKNGDHEDLVSQNRNLIMSAFSLNSKRLILLDQKQQDQILLFKDPATLPAPPLEYDALITNSPNTILGILTADCLPIFVIDQRKKVIAAIHAGRQGTALKITTKVLKRMEEEFGCLSKDLRVALGPSIGPFCYEIDERVFLPEWARFSTPRGGKRWMVDLVQINIAQMKKEGIEEDQISWINLCTHCNSDLLFSYRKEGQTGRQLSFIGMK